MAQQTIGVGASANDGTGDQARTAFTKINDNFTELYTDKAPLASPALTGNPTAPTQTAGNNTTRLATTAFVKAAIDALIGGAPGALDTLDELAAALADDASFAATMTTLLAAKAPLASPAFTGTPTGITKTHVGLGSVDNTSDATKLAAARLGTTTNDSASAGNIGEYIQSEVLSGSAVALTTNTAKTITSIALTAGDWDVTAHGMFLTAASTSITQVLTSISATNDTMDNTPGRTTLFNIPATVPGSTFQTASVPSTRISLAAPATIYMVQRGIFTASTLSGFGRISARRVR